MGFYPKHLKVRRHRWNMRIIATAALSGAMFEHHPTTRHGVPISQWSVHFPDGCQTFAHTKGEAASIYLVWWFDKQNMWPKRSALKKWGSNYRGGN